MDVLTKFFKEICKNEFTKYGFKTYRRNFYRVVNDVFQSFTLHKSVAGNNCTVEFVIVPLCAGDVINKTYCGAHHLKIFEKDWSWFYYDRTDEQSIKNCVSEMIGYMKKYLIPFFEAGNDAKNAYYATYTFQDRNCKDGVFWADPSLFSMALKAGMYETALKHLQAQRANTEHAYNHNKQFFEPSPQYTKSIFDKIHKQDMFIKKIEALDLEYIAKFIHDNEQIALANLGMLKKQ